MFAHWQIHHDWGIYCVHTYIYKYIYILQFCILLTDPLHNITPKLLVLLLYRAQIADLGDHSFFKFLFYVVPTITGKPLFVFLKWKNQTHNKEPRDVDTCALQNCFFDPKSCKLSVMFLQKHAVTWFLSSHISWYLYSCPSNLYGSTYSGHMLRTFGWPSWDVLYNSLLGTRPNILLL